MRGSYILIIDDFAEIRSYLKRVLTRSGYDVKTAADRASAVQILETNEIDLVIADCTIALYVGRDFFKEVLDKRPGTGIIVMSGCFSNDEKELCVKAGAHGCLNKPIDPEILVSEVEGFFRRNQYGRAHLPSLQGILC